MSSATKLVVNLLESSNSLLDSSVELSDTNLDWASVNTLGNSSDLLLGVSSELLGNSAWQVSDNTSDSSANLAFVSLLGTITLLDNSEDDLGTMNVSLLQVSNELNTLNSGSESEINGTSSSGVTRESSAGIVGSMVRWLDVYVIFWVSVGIVSVLESEELFVGNDNLVLTSVITTTSTSS
jgi:hypothetical protein